MKRFLLWCCLYFVLTTVGFMIGRSYKNYEIMSWLLLLGFILMCVVYFVKGYVKLSFGSIGRRMVWPAVVMSLLVAVANLLLLMSVSTLLDVDSLFSEDVESMKRTSEYLFSGIPGILQGGVFAPIAEEIGFRGILLGGLLKTRCRPWIAILVSALVFALGHGFGVSFVGAMVFGIIVGWLYWRTDSIIPGILIHIANNSLSFINLSGQSNTVCLIIFVASLLLLAFGLWWFWKKIKAMPGYQRLE